MQNQTAPAVKPAIKKHLQSERFQRAFRSMVGRTTRYWNKRAFQLGALPYSMEIKTSGIECGICLGTKGVNLINETIPGEKKLSVFSEFRPLIHLYTHLEKDFTQPQRNSMHDYLLPSANDARAIHAISEIGFSTMGIMVSVGTHRVECSTRHSQPRNVKCIKSIVVFQNISSESPEKYKMASEELIRSSSNPESIVRVVNERNTLRMLRFEERNAQDVLTGQETDLILETMKLEFYPRAEKR